MSSDEVRGRGGEGGGSQGAPAGRGKRFFKLAGMTASVATKYAGSRIKGVFQSREARDEARSESNRAMGERIARTLGELKGAAMKIGQMASIGADVLPRELADALKVLQKEAPPVSFDVISDMIEQELGSPPEMLFQHFERKPFASASIGQVHRARTDDGREVVVKVQYPGVDGSVDSDLSHLKLALRASGLLKLDKRAMSGLFDEIRDRLHEELDYCNEADNVRFFQAHHKDHPFIVIPDVIGERSAQRVLTLAWEPGDTIHDLDERGYDQQARDKIGENLFRICLSQIFDLKAIHADPNPANFAFRPDGTVVMYDFGCVKRLEPEIVEAYALTIRSGILEDYDNVERGLLGLGARNPDGPPIDHDYYRMWRDIILQPFLQQRPFDYGKARVHEAIVKQVPSLLKRLDSFMPPVEAVFIDRVVGGHYGNLRKIGSVGHFLDLVTPVLGLPTIDELDLELRDIPS